jgi:hypothetical protein
MVGELFAGSREVEDARGRLRDGQLGSAALELSLAAAQEESRLSKALLQQQQSLQQAAMRELEVLPLLPPPLSPPCQAVQKQPFHVRNPVLKNLAILHC